MIYSRSAFKETTRFLNGSYPFSVMYSASPQRMYPHFHAAIELMYFYSTNGTNYVLGEENLNVRAGDLVVVNPLRIHECPDFKNAVVCCVLISSEATAAFSREVLPSVVRDEAIGEIFQKIEALFKKKSRAEHFQKAACIYEILSLLYEKYSLKAEKSDREYEEEQEIARKTAQYIQSRFSDKITLDCLARNVALSVSRFSHIFKNATGITPAEYIESIRLKEARRLLTETDRSVMNIALSCGYSDHSYFSHRFRFAMGVTPLSYRKIHR